MINLNDLEKDIQQYGGGNNSNKFEFDKTQKKTYKIRILNFPSVLATHFFGQGVPSVVCVGIESGCEHHEEDDKKPSIKLVTYIIDREDGKLKIAELPLSTRYDLKLLQEDEDFAFHDFPLPYDVKITSDPKNSDPKGKYKLLGSPKREPLTSEEQESFNVLMNRMTPEQYIEKRKAKYRNVGGATQEDTRQVSYPTAESEEIDLDDKFKNF